MLGFDSSSSSREQPAQTTSAQPISAENGKEVIGKMADSVGAAEVLTVDGDRDADRVSSLTIHGCVWDHVLKLTLHAGRLNCVRSPEQARPIVSPSVSPA